MREFVDVHLSSRRGKPLHVLDVGAMDVNGSYRQFFDDPAWSYVGMDIEAGDGVDIVESDPYSWRQLKAASFDVVISGQALEHIEFPWVTMLEISRVLRPGGMSCVIAPAGGYEHRYPVDCYRYYRDGMIALAHWADLDVVEASTNWDARGYSDDSDQWMDSVLITQKRDSGSFGVPSVLNRMKLRVLHAATALQAHRRSAITR